MSHILSMPHRIMQARIVVLVKPHDLIAALIKATNKSPTAVATEMRSRSFQGTLHKFVAGNVPSPTHETAQTIARYFDLPIDALYSEKAATRLAIERGIDRSSSGRPTAEEPPAVYALPAKSTRALPDELELRILALRPDQRAGLETVIRAYLDALAPVRVQKTRRR